MPSHVLDRFYAAALPPLTVLYYFQPGLAAATGAAIGTLMGIQQFLRRRKPTP